MSFTFKLLIVLLCCNTLFAQSKSDCDGGYLICDLSAVQIDEVRTAGDDDTELSSFIGECLSEEFQSVWFKWQCETSGRFAFTITPDNYTHGEMSDDIDFAVFSLPDGINSCENKEMIRCMASGESGGCSFEDWIHCNGPTGISMSSNDKEERSGCTQCTGGNDDNFVSAIDMKAGESYALVVMNFSGSGRGYRIDWGGDGTLTDFGQDCEQQNISSSEELRIIRPRIITYPNPAINTITFKAENFSRKLKVKVYNSQGNKVSSFRLKDEKSLNISDLPNGLYYYTTPMDERIKVGKIIKI